MCGIVGYVGTKSAVDVMLPALARLEYRGYDSAGVAAVNGNGIEVRRAVGKLSALQEQLARAPIHGTRGIGHTRWATHGRVTVENAHPHVAGRVAVIHNGIIENDHELRTELASMGRELRSETDTELIAHLLDVCLNQGMTLREAARETAKRLVGSFAIVAIDEKNPDVLLAAKTATPIVIGTGRDESFVASDVPAILAHTRDVRFLEDGEVAEVTADGVDIYDLAGTPRQRAATRIAWDPITAQKGGYPHFLAKEIHEQPTAVANTLRGRVVDGRVRLRELDAVADRLCAIERVTLVACGTSWHAGLVARRFLEELTGLPVDVDYASEFRYRPRVVDRDRDLMIFVSQSGETADTLGSLERAREAGAPTLSVCNVVDSSIARRSDAVLYTQAGPEISVGSTKAFTTQLTALLLASIDLSRRLGRQHDHAEEVERSLPELPGVVERALECEETVRRAARRCARARDALYLGRGIHYPIALEGALKLKEISYIHAEGYPAGEMKHGPIALVTPHVPVVVVMPHDGTFSKTFANAREVESRGAPLLIVTDRRSPDIETLASEVFVVPETPTFLAPFATTIPLQLLAYHTAVSLGTDVDQPRNLAKSVTVE